MSNSKVTSNSQCSTSSAGLVLQGQIEQLRNIQLLSGQIEPDNYALHRSIEDLTAQVAASIAGLDTQILEAINPSISLCA